MGLGAGASIAPPIENQKPFGSHRTPGFFRPSGFDRRSHGRAPSSILPTDIEMDAAVTAVPPAGARMEMAGNSTRRDTLFANHRSRDFQR